MNMQTNTPDENINCSCQDREILTMAFVNLQPLNEIYGESAGFERGTIFPNLDKPFTAGGMQR